MSNIIHMSKLMLKRSLLVVMLSVLSVLGGCASVGTVLPSSADSTAQQFFNYLERSKRQEAYGLFAKGLSQTITFDQFDQFLETLEEHWGRIESEETAIMPFHQRLGERSFIPLNTEENQIKRYTFDVKFEHAQINCDMTLVNFGSEYKIIWFTFWGSSVYMTPEINDKIQELFAKPEEQ